MRLIQIVVTEKQGKDYSFLVGADLLKHSYDDCINKCLEYLGLKRGQTLCIATCGLNRLEDLQEHCHRLLRFDVANYMYLEM